MLFSSRSRKAGCDGLVAIFKQKDSPEPVRRVHVEPRPLLVPGSTTASGSQIPLWPDDVAYFFTAAAVEQGFIRARWVAGFCGRSKMVHARLVDGRILPTGRTSMADLMSEYEGIAVMLNQSVAVILKAAKEIWLKGCDPRIEVEIPDEPRRECLHISRRYKRSLQRALGIPDRRRRAAGAGG